MALFDSPRNIKYFLPSILRFFFYSSSEKKLKAIARVPRNAFTFMLWRSQDSSSMLLSCVFKRLWDFDACSNFIDFSRFCSEMPKLLTEVNIYFDEELLLLISFALIWVDVSIHIIITTTGILHLTEAGGGKERRPCLRRGGTEAVVASWAMMTTTSTFRPNDIGTTEGREVESATRSPATTASSTGPLQGGSSENLLPARFATNRRTGRGRSFPVRMLPTCCQVLRGFATLITLLKIKVIGRSRSYVSFRWRWSRLDDISRLLQWWCTMEVWNCRTNPSRGAFSKLELRRRGRPEAARKTFGRPSEGRTLRLRAERIRGTPVSQSQRRPRRARPAGASLFTWEGEQGFIELALE